MRKWIQLCMVLLLLLLPISCNQGNSRQKGINIFMPTSTARPYEILVVVDQGMWERPAGRSLFNVLDTDMPGLPQSERSFRMMYTDPQNYDATLKLIRNIIIVDVEPIYTHPKFRYENDVYSSPQTILTIQSPDEKSFEEFVTQNKQVIIDFFTRAEMNRQISFLHEKYSEFIHKTVKEMFDCDVYVSSELGSYKRGENFFWAGTNTATNDRNYVIYTYPYTDRRTFTKDFFIHKRDSVMKINIPGSREGVYMSTDSLLTDVRAFKLKGQYIFEARGLWRMKGDMMGGPFVSHAVVDELNHRVVVTEIFVYSPDKLKRNLVRQMEASLYTLKLPKSEEMNEIPLDVEPGSSNKEKK